MKFITKKIGAKIPAEQWWGTDADPDLRIQTKPRGWMKNLGPDKLDTFLAAHCKTGHDVDAIKAQVVSSWNDINNYRKLLLQDFSKLDPGEWKDAHYSASSAWDDMTTALTLNTEHQGTAYQTFPKFDWSVVVTGNEFRKGLRSLVRAKAKKGRKKRSMQEAMGNDTFSLLDTSASKKRKQNETVLELDGSEVTHRRQYILHLFLISPLSSLRLRTPRDVAIEHNLKVPIRAGR